MSGGVGRAGSPGDGAGRRRPWPVRVLAFTGWYLRRFAAANVDVVREVLTPGTGVEPAVVRHRLRCRTDVEVASFVALVGLTPGSLVVGTRDGHGSTDGTGGDGDGGDGEVVGAEVAVHVMHAPDAARALADLVDLEDRMLEAFRRRPADGPSDGAPRPGRADPSDRAGRPPGGRR